MECRQVVWVDEALIVAGRFAAEVEGGMERFFDSELGHVAPAEV